MEITKEMFERYVAVQMSGVCNMFDLPMVWLKTGLSKEAIKWIMMHYTELEKKYKVAENYGK